MATYTVKYPVKFAPMIVQEVHDTFRDWHYDVQRNDGETLVMMWSPGATGEPTDMVHIIDGTPIEEWDAMPIYSLKVTGEVYPAYRWPDIILRAMLVLGTPGAPLPSLPANSTPRMGSRFYREYYGRHR